MRTPCAGGTPNEADGPPAPAKPERADAPPGSGRPAGGAFAQLHGPRLEPFSLVRETGRQGLQFRVGDGVAAFLRPLDLRRPIGRVTQSRRFLPHMLRPGDHLIGALGHVHPDVGHLTSGVRASDPGLGARLGGCGHRGSRMGAGLGSAGDMSAGLGPGLRGLPASFPRMNPRFHSRLTGLDDGLTLLFGHRSAVVDPT